MSGESPKKIGRGYARNLDAGPFQPMIDSLDLHLRAEKKSAKTIRTYLEAAQWFAAEYLIPAGLDDWDEVKAQARPGMDGYPAGPVLRLPTPTTSSVRCSSSSSGTPARTQTSRAPTQWPASSRRRSATSSFPSSPTTSWPRCWPLARAAGSRTGAITRSYRCSRIPALGCPSWPGWRSDDMSRANREAVVTGKGDKQRADRFTYDTARALDRYIRERAKHRMARASRAVARACAAAR